MHRGGEELHVLGKEKPMSISAEYKAFCDNGIAFNRGPIWKGCVAYMKEFTFFPRLFGGQRKIM